MSLASCLLCQPFWRHCLRFLPIILLCGLPVCFSHADIQDSCAVFCGARDQLDDTGVTPVRQLDNTALFESAVAMRDQSMPAEQRVLNYFWLQETAATRIQGGRVWTRLFRHGVANFRAKQPHQSAPPDNKTFSWDNSDLERGAYRVRISDDYVRIIFHYDF